MKVTCNRTLWVVCQVRGDNCWPICGLEGCVSAYRRSMLEKAEKLRKEFVADGDKDARFVVKKYMVQERK